MEKKSRTSQLDHERMSKLAAHKAGLKLVESVKARREGKPSPIAFTIVGRNFAAEARLDTYQWLNDGKPRPDACAAPAKWVLSSDYKEASAYPNATDALATELAATLSRLWPSWETAEERLTYVGSLELKEDTMREQFRPGSKLASLEMTPREVLESEWDGADAGELKGGEPLYQAFVDTTPNADETMLVHDEALAVVLESTGAAGAKASVEFRSKAKDRWERLRTANQNESDAIERARASFAKLSALVESCADEAYEPGPAWTENQQINDAAERAFTERQDAEHDLWRRWLEPSRWRDKKVWQDSDVWGGDGPPYPLFVVTLAHAVWVDVVRPRLEEAQRKPPALVRAVHVSATTFHSRMPKFDENSRTLSFEGRELAELYGTFDIDIIVRGLSLLGSVAAHKLFRWEVLTGHERAIRGEPRANVLEVEGGWAALAQMLGLNPNKPKVTSDLRSIVHTQAQFLFNFPDGSRGNMLVLNERPAQGRQRAQVRLELGSVLMPGYVQGLPPRERKLVPILREPPPLYGRPNEHGQQMTMGLAVMAEFRERATEIVAEGGVQLTDDDWTRLADRSGVPRRLIVPVRTMWIEGDGGRAAPFLKLESRSRYTLADAHADERLFLEEAGKAELSGAKAGKKGAARRRAKIARLGRP